MSAQRSGFSSGGESIARDSALPRAVLPLLGTIAVTELVMLAAIPVASGEFGFSGLTPPPVWPWTAALVAITGLVAIWSRRRPAPSAVVRRPRSSGPPGRPGAAGRARAYARFPPPVPHPDGAEQPTTRAGASRTGRPGAPPWADPTVGPVGPVEDADVAANARSASVANERKQR